MLMKSKIIESAPLIYKLVLNYQTSLLWAAGSHLPNPIPHVLDVPKQMSTYLMVEFFVDWINEQIEEGAIGIVKGH